jgi:hypothetical protein
MVEVSKIVQVRQNVKVTVDESKFDETFMEEFRESFYKFRTLDDHIEHLGQLYARGIYDNHDFIEGYGDADDMGIKFKFIDQETESFTD